VSGATLGFSFESRLAAPADEVWAHATSMAGVNRELFPLARMTAPRGVEKLDERDIVPGRRVFRSWILAGGLLPIDFDDLTFVEIGPRRFLERSPMLSQRWWQHERVVESAPFGSILRDTVEFEPRFAVLGKLQLPVFRLAFWNRHRQLVRIFGAA
jgi:ligand-binding SRPBCC domain-containing protein